MFTDETKAKIGHGITLASAPLGGTTFDPLAEVFGLSGPRRTVNMVDATHYQSPDMYTEQIPGMKSGGTLSGNANYRPDTRVKLEACYGVRKSWKITYPDGSTDAFDGTMSELGQESPHDDRMTCPFSIAISGPVKFTPGTTP